MLSKDPNQPQSSPAPEGSVAEGGSAVPPMKPGSPIEVAPPGDGTINDPLAKDTKPPGVGESDLYLLG